ncbi:MAG: 7-cyano-7-deazaguanine synthase QueC [Phycisphaerales bacterium]|nr:MAG: 7-cyano-7-deazaguanine synthase QueC [Phycisphaerales bacterium]
MSELPQAGGAVVLLSGGLDSAVTAAIARAAGHRLFALSFLYGQRHAVERDAACSVAAAMGVVRHVVQTIDLRVFGGSALTADIDVPKPARPATAEPAARTRTLPPPPGGIPLTYVPARNTIFLAFALAYAETVEASAIYLGVNAVDYSGYPDCRPEYIRRFQAMADVATRAALEGTPIRILAPLIDMTKAQIIRRGLELGVDFSLTHSCYDPEASGRACGRCESCLIRLDGFRAAGLADPAPYQNP